MELIEDKKITKQVKPLCERLYNSNTSKNELGEIISNIASCVPSDDLVRVEKTDRVTKQIRNVYYIQKKFRFKHNLIKLCIYPMLFFNIHPELHNYEKISIHTAKLKDGMYFADINDGEADGIRKI